ncbi:hypothetical protein QMO40_00575 [Mannheimia bovis]|uniref:hypothetical protein n=1 Tax=Mannheimia bovis TaxID=2770636 RepID=UPI0024B81571|nr:hypothetical protein [Mannheimia bovis]WHP47208.1 hypothetical protein QMO40_00575 [Mannheimia bovis]
MSKKMFILMGSSDTGKTTTFNHIFRQMSTLFLEQLVYFYRHSNGIDFLTVFKNKHNQRIGIYSAGDNEEEIRSSLYELNNQCCDFIFGTSRTKGKGYEIIEKYASLFYGHSTELDIIKWYRKEGANDKDNKRVEKELFSDINKLFEIN